MRSSARGSSRTSRPSCCPRRPDARSTTATRSRSCPGLHRMKSECLDRLQPDTVVVFDTHWESTFEHIVTAQERRQGNFTSHELPRGMAGIPYDMPGDPELAKLIAAQAEGRDDCWILACDDPYLPIFYGTVNIWTFLGDPDTRWISVAINQCCTTEDFLLFGRADRRRDRARATGASCCSRVGRHDPPVLPVPGAPAPRELEGARRTSSHLESYEADQHVLAHAAGGRPRGRDRLDARVQEGRARGPLRALPDDGVGASAARVARRRASCSASTRRRSGTGQVHVWFERPADGWTGGGAAA